MRQAAKVHRPVPDVQVAELERLVREGVLSREVAAPALAEARRQSQPVVTPLPSERLWRGTVAALREILQGEDVAAARETLREILGVIRLTPGEGHLIAELTARPNLLGHRVLLRTGTGTGIWVGSGGALLIHIPTGSRRKR